MKKSGAYLIICEATGERYVGGSVHMYRRISVHFCELRQGIHSNKRMQRAWNKYGEGQFSSKYLEKGDDVLGIERAWIKRLEPEFNEFTEPDPRGRKTPESILAKMRGPRPLMANNQNAKGAKRSLATRAKMAAAKKGVPSKLRGRTLSGEHKAKISATKRLLAGSNHIDCDCMSCRPP